MSSPSTDAATPVRPALQFIDPRAQVPVVHLDATDRRILATLQECGEVSTAELAATIALSASQCLRRMRSLEKRGLIPARRTRIAAPCVDTPVMAYVGLHVVGGASGRPGEIEARIRAFRQVVECHLVSGDSNYLLKVVAEDLAALSEFLNTTLRLVPGIARINSMICLEEIKPFAPMSRDEPHAVADIQGGHRAVRSIGTAR